jgi:hypothetical protein
MGAIAIDESTMARKKRQADGLWDIFVSFV